MTDTSVHNHSVTINFYHHSLYIQAQYSLLCRSTEWELLEVCNREHIAMLPWSPLKGLALNYNIMKWIMQFLLAPPLQTIALNNHTASNSLDHVWYTPKNKINA